MKLFNKIKGAINEDKALKYIKKEKKYQIIECNYSNKIGEIDIIAYDKKTDTTVFVEVKYRTTQKYGLGREAVDERKAMKIRNIASVYLKGMRKLNSKVRFDVIDILGEDLTYIENAF